MATDVTPGWSRPVWRDGADGRIAPGTAISALAGAGGVAGPGGTPAEEGLDELGAGRQLRRGSLHPDLAAAEHVRAVRDGQHRLGPLFHDEHGRAAGRQA